MVVMPALAQLPAGQNSQFEVISIKANKSGQRGGGPIGATGGRFIANNASLALLLNWAFSSNGKPFLTSQIIGMPSWGVTDRFDIQAKAEGEARSISLQEIQMMAISMLEQRFQFKWHRETREMPIFILSVTKPGKIRLSEDQGPTGPSTGPRGFDPSKPPARGTSLSFVANSGGNLLQAMVATAVPISSLVNMLQGQVGRPIVNKTALDGLFDFNLKFSPQGASSGPSATAAPDGADDPLPSLFTVLQDELGLRLDSGKGPVEVLVIDSVQKPSEN
jgi:uncharacterized protein (TIGR03435 family)